MITSDLYKVKDMSNKNIKIKVLSEEGLHGVPKGGIVSVETDRDGIPFNRNWRNRLRDSEIDNCIEIVKTSKKKDVK